MLERLQPMLERLRRRAQSLWPDPARTSLTWWLAAIHLALVLLVAGGITWSASRMLRELADAQGKARVQLAATSVREELRGMGEDAHAAAETQRNDHQCGAVEIRRYIRDAPGHDNSCVRHLPYLRCRMISHDVQDQSWDARLHLWKDCACETQGCVDVGRMPKVAYEEQA